MIDIQHDREQVARKIKFIRKLKKWSQTQLANKINIPRQRLASYEEGRAVCPFRIVKALCVVYEISLNDFEDIVLIEKEVKKKYTC